MRYASLAGVFLFACAILAPAARADRVKLKNGTVLEGTVIKQSTGYWVKTPDGQTHQVRQEEVASVESSRPGATAGTSHGTASAGPRSTPTAAAPSVTPSFAATQRKANAVDTALAAVTIWQQFVDSVPPTPDLPAAKKELEKWKALADGGAEKIKGKWVGGQERKALIDKAKALYKESDDLARSNQTLQSIKKLEEATAIYPNSFEMNFTLGFIYTIQTIRSTGDQSADKAIQWLDEALRVDPDSVAAIADKGVVLFAGKKQYEKGIVLMRKALEMEDSKELVYDLMTAIHLAPPAVQKSRDAREANAACALLATKYALPGPGQQFVPVVPRGAAAGRGGHTGPSKPAGMWSGTGFVISEDGLILTNRHVVDGGKTLMVIFDNGAAGAVASPRSAGPVGPPGTAGDVRKAAEVVAIDEFQDLALIRVKTDGKKLPIVRLSPADNPPAGAECTVMGYPLLDRLGASVKITRGIVSDPNRRDAADVLVDAKVNPGNSGGPIFDKHGNVMAIVCMKTLASTTEDTYGLGISAGKIRQFLAKNKVTVPPGDAKGAALNTEEVVTNAKPATVCILATR